MRYFTLKEANEVVKELRPLLKPVVQAVRRWDSLNEAELRELDNQIQWLLRAAESEGFIIRDLANGIVDFPALTKDGELIYLCSLLLASSNLIPTRTS